jgi:two-component system, OmpR family, KDP operon response regulator KdpE
VNRILVVDDDPQILRVLRINLTAHGYQVVTAADGAAALAAAAEHLPDVIVLDLGLPDCDGANLIPELKSHATMGVIVLSARIDSGDKVQALDKGADDYVTKPFAMDEFLARIRAAVRRGSTPPATPGAVVETDDFTIDLAAKSVYRHGEPIHLTPTEWNLLHLLVRNRGRLVTQREMLEEVWGTGDRKETSYLRFYLAQLRRKLEPDPSRPRHLITEKGMGYRFTS